MPFSRDSHYVPSVYLKGFASSPEKIQTYSLLVAHENAPLWKERSIRGIGYHSHLYTRLVNGTESDEVEQWLNKEFETPAQPVLRKAIADAPLSKGEWNTLIRFVAAQDVRTPAGFAESVRMWEKYVPAVLDNSLHAAIEELKSADQNRKHAPSQRLENSDYVPVGIKQELSADGKDVKLTAQIVLGRGLWLYQIKHVLTHTIAALQPQRWTIIRPPTGVRWFTTDNPVLKLNYHNSANYDFKGGWARRGTEIMLPLDPTHLLYTKVGHQPPLRGSIFERQEAHTLRRLIAQHAHRYIFADSVIPDIEDLRPRVVDADLLRYEAEQWGKWNENQIAAERKLLRN